MTGAAPCKYCDTAVGYGCPTPGGYNGSEWLCDACAAEHNAQPARSIGRELSEAMRDSTTRSIHRPRRQFKSRPAEAVRDDLASLGLGSRRKASHDRERAKDLNHRVWRHRRTGEIRAAEWTESGVLFLAPASGEEFTRPYRKALRWCAEADDITEFVEGTDDA